MENRSGCDSPAGYGADPAFDPPVLDALIQSRDLKMLKSVVPYLDSSRQRMVSLVIRLIELQKTLRLFEAGPGLQAAELRICENNSPAERACRMLHALREYCQPAEQESIDMFLNFFDMYSSCGSLFSDASFPDMSGIRQPDGNF